QIAAGTPGAESGNMPRFAVILPAAGSSSRFGGRQSKLVTELAGVAVIARAVLPFVQRTDTHQILIAVPNDPLAAAPLAQQNLSRLDEPAPAGRANEIWEALSREPAVKNRLGGQVALVPGGPTRAHRGRAGLRGVPGGVGGGARHAAGRPMLAQELT